MESSLTRDLPAARLHLERAYHYLGGNDDICRKGREALDLLIEAIAAAEHARPAAKVLKFPPQPHKAR